MNLRQRKKILPALIGRSKADITHTLGLLKLSQMFRVISNVETYHLVMAGCFTGYLIDSNKRSLKRHLTRLDSTKA